MDMSHRGIASFLGSLIGAKFRRSRALLSVLQTHIYRKQDFLLVIAFVVFIRRKNVYILTVLFKSEGSASVDMLFLFGQDKNTLTNVLCIFNKYLILKDGAAARCVKRIHPLIINIFLSSRTRS